MKKILYTTILAMLGVIPLRAQVQFFEPFNYADGALTNVSGGVWQRHSGGNNDSLVSSNRLQVFGTRADDVNRSFPTNLANPIFVAFTLNMTTLPSNSFGTYFAHFKDNTTFGFRGRIFAVTDNATWGVFPGMYRIGIANANGDGTGAPTNGPSVVVPMDLALNTDYQIVAEYDPNAGATVWVNPVTTDDLNSGISLDAGLPLTNGISSYAFRQNTGQGKQTVDNVAVGLTFDDVVTNVPASKPFFGVQPVGYTNFSGNPFTLVSAASGSGALTYQWFQGTNLVFTGPIYSVASAQPSDSGDYTVVVGNSFGSVTSVVATVSVDGTQTAPFITTQPNDATNQVSNPVAFTVAAQGTGPLSYQWYFNDLSNPISGANGPSYSIPQIDTNNAGGYFVVVSGGVAPTIQSRTAVLTVNPIPHVSIGFLRSLEDPTTWQATDTSTLWNATGVVITATNETSGNTSSYYIQDATGGINLFISGGQSFRPQIGDLVTATGPLQSFNDSLELSLLTSNPFHTFSVLSSGNPLLAATVLSPASTNNVPFMEGLESSLVMMTNVYFVKGGGTNTFRHGTTYVITNSSGVGFNVFLGTVMSNLDGMAIPPFAWTISGALSQFNSANTNLTAGYELLVTRYQDIVTTPPLAVTATAGMSGADINLGWNAQTNIYPYSVFAAANAAGPYSQIFSGLVFTNASGAFTVTNGDSSPMQFFKISSP
jgi:hypothetical protein